MSTDEMDSAAGQSQAADEQQQHSRENGRQQETSNTGNGCLQGNANGTGNGNTSEAGNDETERIAHNLNLNACYQQQDSSGQHIHRNLGASGGMPLYNGSNNQIHYAGLNVSMNNSGGTPTLLDVHKGRPIRLQVKVLVPIHDHPNYNFVGKLLGPKGNSLKWLQEQTQTKMAILGRGSMRDRAKEEELRALADPKHAHLNEDLHVEITCYASAPEAYLRVGHALHEIKRFLVPDYYDEIRQQQLRELGVLTTEPPGLAGTTATVGTIPLINGSDSTSIGIPLAMDGNSHTTGASCVSPCMSASGSGTGSSPQCQSSIARSNCSTALTSTSITSSISALTPSSVTSLSPVISSNSPLVSTNSMMGGINAVRPMTGIPLGQQSAGNVLAVPHLAAAMVALQQQNQFNHLNALTSNSILHHHHNQTNGPVFHALPYGSASGPALVGHPVQAVQHHHLPAIGINATNHHHHIPVSVDNTPSSGAELFDISHHYDGSWDSQQTNNLKVAAAVSAQRKAVAAAAAAASLLSHPFQTPTSSSLAAAASSHPGGNGGVGPVSVTYAYHARQMKPYTRIYPEFH